MVMKFYQHTENRMGSKSYKVSAPGSLMLFGEHAVLHGKQAIVVAIDQYIRIELIPRLDRKIQIESCEFGTKTISLDKFEITKPYNYVLTAIKQYLNKNICGFTLKINSDFPANIGFGSSAAVTVATIGVLSLWLNGKPLDQMKLYRQAAKTIRLVHGIASGADVAASVFGGIIAYKMKPAKIQKINTRLPLIAVYSGSKTPTFKVIAKVEKENSQSPALFTHLYNAIGCCAKNAIDAIKKNDLARLGKLMEMHQGIQIAMGVSTTTLEKLISSLHTKPSVRGVKISGAGLGDCVVGLGKIPLNTFPQNNIQKKLGIKQIEVAISKEGFHCNK
jgi:mevalonate kinase